MNYRGFISFELGVSLMFLLVFLIFVPFWLRWVNSSNSLSHIDGFFLRLRLRQWEEGLGGTGYHVACIVGITGIKPCFLTFFILKSVLFR